MTISPLLHAMQDADASLGEGIGLIDPVGLTALRATLRDSQALLRLDAVKTPSADRPTL